jgi:general secretion pathway protein E/type IV pilus assembly protein PilB
VPIVAPLDLAALAVRQGLITMEEIEAVRRNGTDEPVAALLAAGRLTEALLTRALATELALPFRTSAAIAPSPEALAKIPAEFARAHRVLPLELAADALTIVVADPLDVAALDQLPMLVGLPVQLCVATPSDVTVAIQRHYGTGTEDDELRMGWDTPASAPTAHSLAASEESSAENDAPIIRLVYSIIRDAIQRRASDIHLEPLEKRFRVRYRIDGSLVEVGAPPKRLQLAVISRLKIMAHISIAEKRIPQDGRIQVVLDGHSLDLRVASLPTAHGESIVMRILDQEGLRLGLPELGFEPDDQAAFEKLIAAPDGMILVTGPTGSGKTTTLYAALHQLNQPGRKIITVEEPVEYQLGGINQVPVNNLTGMTFAAALRAMLRQSPNIVMVGEIRDLETAEIAVNASLTGHLVLSTLHTNDAPSAVTRLGDIGAKPFLVAAALRATMAQRLVRRICPGCRQPHVPGAAELRALGLDRVASTGVQFFRGTGCPACLGTGYRGRLSIVEIFPIDDAVRRLIYDRASAGRLRAAARAAGMRTMRADGVRKILAGRTTIEEVLSATVGDDP